MSDAIFDTPLDGCSLIEASAGTGKTFVLAGLFVRAVFERRLAPQQVLAVTFTARAAGEMRTRLRELGIGGVQARTFHAAALRQVDVDLVGAGKDALPGVGGDVRLAHARRVAAAGRPA